MRVFDGHCDTLFHCYEAGSGLERRSGHLDLERLERFQGSAQFFAIFGSKEDTPDRPLFEVFQSQYRIFCRELERHAHRMTHCRTASEMERAWQEGKVAAFLSVEGADLLDCDLSKLKLAYDLGVRAVNLTWNFGNPLSGSNAEDPGRGLSQLGRDFVRAMQELGMLVDVSHLSDPGFWDVMELASKPILASHSNSRAVCGHKRNLTDEQFTAIINNHGVAGLNMCDEFLGDAPTIDTVVSHVEHWFALGGEKNVSLGGDWDGISFPPKGISGIQDLEKLAERLLRLNYPEERVNDLFYKNLMRVVSEVCTM